MGRYGESILLKELKKRFSMLEFVTGFIVCNGKQSPQLDILVCRKNMYKRQLEGGMFLVDPIDCLMVIEVKGNITLTDIAETNKKNKFFSEQNETKHIQYTLFAFKTRIGKRSIFYEFGYKYNNRLKTYYEYQLNEEKMIDIFVCLHRDSLNSNANRDKQIFFIKDTQNKKQYLLDNNYPVMQNFCRYLQSLQE